MDLSIAIVTHNSISPVEKCLRSLEEHPPSSEFEVIVVDNASSDGTPEMIRESFPRARVIANADNRGYSKGVNQAFRESSGRYFLVLNPDIVVGEGAIDSLESFMDGRPGAGIAGSKLVFPDGTVQPSCRSFYTIRALLLRRTFLGKIFPRAKALRDHLMTDYDHAEAREVDWIIGACMIVRREAAEEVGPMDERFFLYFEDTDWCYRMKQRGWQVWYVPESTMVHLYERSSAKSVLSRPFMLHMLSLMRYYEKWNAVFHFFRRNRGTIKTLVFVIGDLIMINASFLASYYLRSWLQPLFSKGLYPLDWYTVFIIFYNALFLLTFASTGLYRIRRGTEFAEELSSVIKSVLLIFMILLTASYLTKVRIFSRAVLAGHAAFSVILVTGARRLVRRVHGALVAASFDLRRVLIAGSPSEAGSFAESAAGAPASGIDIIGRIGEGEGALGGIDEMAGVVERFQVQELVVLPSAAGPGSIERIMTNPVSRSLRINIVSPAARVTGTDTRSEQVGGVYMFAVERGASFLITRAVLRVIDIAAGIVLLPVCAFCWIPMALAAAAGGASLFTERRAGVKGDFSWPRAVLRGGREASDLVKPLLALQLVAGRLSLTGPPPMPAGAGGRAASRPGISGAWRAGKVSRPENAVVDEILLLNNQTFTGRILLMVRSVIPCLSGRYPDWFHSKGVER